MPDELKPHLDALRHWIERHTDIQAPIPSISAEERKQLHTVNKSIQQLTSLGVIIPDDLRKLKLGLAAKDVNAAMDAKIRSRLVQVESLVENLRELMQKARTLRNSLKGSGQASGTKKRYDVSLKELLESGHLSTDDKLELRWKKGGLVFEGEVWPDGSVSVNTNAGWKQFNALSTAACSISGRSLNGWVRWRRIESDGSRTTLKAIRDKYMNQRGGA